MSSPNVLLITVDSLRADHALGDGAETPSIDRIAAAGTATEAFAQGPFTTFSMPSLFTSRYPGQLRAIDFVDGVQGVLVEGAPTLQERLGDAGYATAGIHSNPLLSEMFGFDRGFDYFEDGLDGPTPRLPERLRLLADKIGRLVRRTAYVPAEELTDRALAWLEGTDEEPWFLWVHYMDVHGPYQSTHGRSYVDKLRSEWLWRKAVHSPDEVTSDEHERLRRAYRSEVEYTDDAVGRLLDGVAANAAPEDTFVVLTADHGDEFAEHGSYSHDSKLYDELIRVPLVVDPPEGMTFTPREGPTPLLDVAPTLVDIAGGTVQGFEGRSRHGSNEHDGAEGILAEAKLPPEYVGCVRTGNWKYIENTDGHELYDLTEDPGETDDRSDVVPEVAEEFAERLATHRERAAGERRSGEALESDELNERLRRLGYLE